MRRIPGGPDRDAVEAQVRAYRARMRRRIVEGPAFPVLGAAADPPLRRSALLTWYGRDDVLTGITLLFGDPFSATGPVVTVLTATAGEPSVDADGLLDDEQRRLVEHTGSLAAVRAPGPRFSRPRVLRVEGLDVTSEVRHEGLAWATVLSPPGMAGVRAGIVGRGVAVEAVVLQRLANLGPLVTAGEQLLDEVVARAPASPRRAAAPPPAKRVVVPAEPEPLSLDAHRDLLESALRFPDRPWAPGDCGQVWERAVLMQGRLAGQDREPAEDALTACVHHARALAEHADWFADPRWRRAALAELIRWTAFDSPVAALEAIRAWETLWRRRAPRTAAHQAWLASWAAWVGDRPS